MLLYNCIQYVQYIKHDRLHAEYQLKLDNSIHFFIITIQQHYITICMCECMCLYINTTQAILYYVLRCDTIICILKCHVKLSHLYLSSTFKTYEVDPKCFPVKADGLRISIHNNQYKYTTLQREKVHNKQQYKM